MALHQSRESQFFAFSMSIDKLLKIVFRDRKLGNLGNVTEKEFK